ncbi:putative ARID/BRIGHT DNA binding domain [Monocercomonoides exilis]|uniref:putative ARID/BRIGHT DNA binding domain n=1 Tax=Monocercomonoides exilis TaxID=2049356 RepID=UPI00355A632C|nr:putative ARID/BRIGHT DNA binding domain [Monocercomonoides exilis]|eukprot:MONOS_8158.1-p1 / transcript=MONOS_8158.1 / gene=MONOS_8158 / organism=Monocercomonoides_exilis_PA203 / gene_product=unspecified product / transcript_product=unspecified product / location=Mono_scaffold00299:18094-23103(-) / protein_length=1611 / sequence_SO=supercontig / SO=protein_coding / is_pseudo=false
MSFLNNKEEFEKSLFEFHEKRGTKIARVPVMSRIQLDLFRLFQVVQKNGGYDEVSVKRLWKKVNREIDIPIIGSSPYIIRKHYKQILYPFERVKIHFLPDDLSIGLDQGIPEIPSTSPNPQPTFTLDSDVMDDSHLNKILTSFLPRPRKTFSFFRIPAMQSSTNVKKKIASFAFETGEEKDLECLFRTIRSSSRNAVDGSLTHLNDFGAVLSLLWSSMAMNIESISYQHWEDFRVRWIDWKEKYVYSMKNEEKEKFQIPIKVIHLNDQLNQSIESLCRSSKCTIIEEKDGSALKDQSYLATAKYSTKAFNELSDLVTQKINLICEFYKKLIQNSEKTLNSFRLKAEEKNFLYEKSKEDFFQNMLNNKYISDAIESDLSLFHFASTSCEEMLLTDVLNQEEFGSLAAETKKTKKMRAFNEIDQHKEEFKSSKDEKFENKDDDMPVKDEERSKRKGKIEEMNCEKEDATEQLSPPFLVFFDACSSLFPSSLPLIADTNTGELSIMPSSNAQSSNIYSSSSSSHISSALHIPQDFVPGMRHSPSELTQNVLSNQLSSQQFNEYPSTHTQCVSNSRSAEVLFENSSAFASVNLPLLSSPHKSEYEKIMPFIEPFGKLIDKHREMLDSKKKALKEKEMKTAKNDQIKEEAVNNKKIGKKMKERSDQKKTPKRRDLSPLPQSLATSSPFEQPSSSSLSSPFQSTSSPLSQNSNHSPDKLSTSKQTHSTVHSETQLCQQGNLKPADESSPTKAESSELKVRIHLNIRRPPLNKNAQSAEQSQFSTSTASSDGFAPSPSTPPSPFPSLSTSCSSPPPLPLPLQPLETETTSISASFSPSLSPSPSTSPSTSSSSFTSSSSSSQIASSKQSSVAVKQSSSDSCSSSSKCSIIPDNPINTDNSDISSNANNMSSISFFKHPAMDTDKSPIYFQLRFNFQNSNNSITSSNLLCLDSLEERKKWMQKRKLLFSSYLSPSRYISCFPRNISFSLPSNELSSSISSVSSSDLFTSNSECLSPIELLFSMAMFGSQCKCAKSTIQRTFIDSSSHSQQFDITSILGVNSYSDPVEASDGFSSDPSRVYTTCTESVPNTKCICCRSLLCLSNQCCEAMIDALELLHKEEEEEVERRLEKFNWLLELAPFRVSSEDESIFTEERYQEAEKEKEKEDKMRKNEAPVRFANDKENEVFSAKEKVDSAEHEWCWKDALNETQLSAFAKDGLNNVARINGIELNEDKDELIDWKNEKEDKLTENQEIDKECVLIEEQGVQLQQIPELLKNVKDTKYQSNTLKRALSYLYIPDKYDKHEEAKLQDQSEKTKFKSFRDYVLSFVSEGSFLDCTEFSRMQSVIAHHPAVAQTVIPLFVSLLWIESAFHHLGPIISSFSSFPHISQIATSSIDQMLFLSAKTQHPHPHFSFPIQHPLLTSLLHLLYLLSIPSPSRTPNHPFARSNDHFCFPSLIQLSLLPQAISRAFVDTLIDIVNHEIYFRKLKSSKFQHIHDSSSCGKGTADEVEAASLIPSISIEDAFTSCYHSLIAETLLLHFDKEASNDCLRSAELPSSSLCTSFTITSFSNDCNTTPCHFNRTGELFISVLTILASISENKETIFSFLLLYSFIGSAYFGK